MSISQREQTALDAMENCLARSSPELASMLTIFSRLAEGEEMPADARVRLVVGDPGTGAAAGGRIGAGRTRRHLGRGAWRWLWLWLAAAVALLALALTVGHGTGQKYSCTASRAGACGQAPVSPAVRPGAGRAGGP